MHAHVAWNGTGKQRAEEQRCYFLILKDMGSTSTSVRPKSKRVEEAEPSIARSHSPLGTVCSLVTS